MFFNQPLVVSLDVKHSRDGNRFYALGRTSADRQLFVAFTMRGNLRPGNLSAVYEPQGTGALGRVAARVVGRVTLVVR